MKRYLILTLLVILLVLASMYAWAPMSVREAAIVALCIAVISTVLKADIVLEWWNHKTGW
jgi:hypothetical protein